MIRRIATLTLTAAGLFTIGFGVADAAPGEPIGPFTSHVDCVDRGSQGILNGEWADFECPGPATGPWYLTHS
ncbi:hypothetical protein [Nocardia sp. NPDC052566]|uniref:hypothetical protein n=1 Tax=Nocardia sp. NPDC052566 TaxID=3364330 RepID=UPI0037CCA884